MLKMKPVRCKGQSGVIDFLGKPGHFLGQTLDFVVNAFWIRIKFIHFYVLFEDTGHMWLSEDNSVESIPSSPFA